MTEPVNYDRLAATYNQRFALDSNDEVAQMLTELTQEIDARRVLEVGCGTGHWLAQLHPLGLALHGLDRSAGMLAQAQARGLNVHLTQGDANALPFAPASFDLIYVINAIHHFRDALAFLAAIPPLLRPGGVLAVAGMDPHEGPEIWYLYEYFAGVYERDQARFPRWEALARAMRAAGLKPVQEPPPHRLQSRWEGAAVLEDPFLKKYSSSQLAQLSDAAYQAGLAKIRARLDEGSQQGGSVTFQTNIPMRLLVGYKQGT